MIRINEESPYRRLFPFADMACAVSAGQKREMEEDE